MTIKPLTQSETETLLILLRRIWREQPETTIGRIAKNLFMQITQSFYEKQK